MDSPAEPDPHAARQLVEEIWRINTLDGKITEEDSSVRRLLENALTVLSRQLYDKETHFLLELIQNAEDNTYNCATPSLSFTYKRGSLRVDCNETGFTESNVRAICKIGESTKATFGRSAQYVGEKGIGFKSVFKVASVVYISSRSFSFKFDRSQAVGPIAPIWSDFPEPLYPGYTSFYLKLSDECNEDQVARDIQNLDPTMLIFLRRLREINLNITLEGGKKWTRRLWREDTFVDGSVITTLHGLNTSRYAVVKHTVSGLPYEQDRVGVFETEILLAFPETSLENQFVHAFLPIRDYGFKFLLQGDFILTANREDVMDNSWNRALREAGADAFVKAIYHLNSGPGRYTWAKYLPGQHILGFFEPLRDLILEKLSQEPILEAYSGRMVAPSLLTHIPLGQFSDNYGQPLTLSPDTMDVYLSSKYPETAAAAFSRLGIQTMDAKGFLEHLNWIISNDPQDFRMRHWRWHSHLAKVLLSLSNNSEHSELIRALDIIPLSNGQWVSASMGPIYFSQGADRLGIPHTVPMRTLAPAAEKNSWRRNLFVHLGVKPRPDAADVCRRIIDMHRDRSFKPDTLTHSELVEHVLFMFGASFDIPPNTDLWFATADDKRAKGSSLYMRASVKVRPFEDRIRKHVEANYRLLHDSYAEAFQAHGPAAFTWRRWIRKCFGVQLSNLPRLHAGAPNGHSKGSLRLSDEFRSLFKECDSSDVLDLLRVGWEEYSRSVESQYLVNGEKWSNPVTEEVAAMKVKCYMESTDTCLLPLRDTFLPKLDKTMDGASCLPLLAVSSPANQGWRALGIFGVSVCRNLEYYIRCLATLKKGAAKPLKATVTHVYERIQAEYMDNKKQICKTFMKHALIYTSLCSPEGDQKMRWVTAEECLEKNADIATEYQSSATLFRNVLGTGTNDIERLVHTLCAITEEERLGDILNLFIKMNRALQVQGPGSFKASIEKLNKWIPLFPVLRRNGDREYDALAPLNPAFPPWFIADRHHLRDSFCGCVDILAFPPEDLNSIEDFLKALDLESRLLSRIVKVESSPMGKPKRHNVYTLSLRRKAAFITSLIPKQLSNREVLAKEFFFVEVSIAAKIVQRYKFEYGLRSFSGVDGQGEVALSEKNGRLHVFMTRDNISATIPPPELGNRLCDHFNIVNPAHRNLVHFALGEKSQERLYSVFAREGVHVLESDLRGIGNDFAALWRDEFLDVRVSDEDSSEDDSDQHKLESKFKHIPANFATDVDEGDRRLPLQYFKWSDRILFRSTSCDPATEYQAVLRTEPAHGQYVAEVLTSRFLQKQLGSLYEPGGHWTSPQRYKAGHSKFPYSVTSNATFTISSREASRKFSDFLAQSGFKDANDWAWTASDPTYHLDIAVSPGGPRSDFSWTTHQFERMRSFRLDKQRKDTWRHENVHVLVRISDVFNTPQLELFVDPWRLFASDRFALRGNWTFSATILDAGQGPTELSSFQQSPAHPSLPGTQSSTSYNQSFPWTNPCSRAIDSHGTDGYHLPQHPSFDAHLHHQSATVNQPRPQDILPEQSQYPASQDHQLRDPFQSTTHYQQMHIVPPTNTTSVSQGTKHVLEQKSYELQGHQGQGSYTTDYSSLANNYNQWPAYNYNASLDMGGQNWGFLPVMPQQFPNSTLMSDTAPLSIAISASGTGTEVEFSYKQLNKGDIRLLILFPGEKNAQLRAIVYRCPLFVATSFQAISYTWGSSDFSHSLWTPEGTIKLTASLHTTLCCLRHESQPLILWADGICINQNDKDEKSGQIRLLPQIFQRATCVLVSLGSDSRSDGAMETLMQIRVAHALAEMGEEWPKDLAQVPVHWRKRKIPLPDDPIWSDISALFERTWFERSWIIQEVVVATSVRVVCGKWLIDWNDLLAAIEIIMRESQASSHEPLGKTMLRFQRFMTLASLREKEAQHDRRPLLELLEAFRDTKVTVEQDRFFCLLGLAIDGNNPSFVLDYHLGFDAIVRKYAWAFIQQGKVLDLLHRAGANPRDAQCFPSWIPDWTVAKQDSLRTLAAWGMACAASRHVKPRIDASSTVNDMELRLYGMRVDEIELISKSSNVAEEFGSYLAEIDNMVCSSISNANSGIKWKVPIAGALRCRHDGLSMEESYTALREYLALVPDRAQTSEARSGMKECSSSNANCKESLWTRAQNYYLALQRNIMGWKFIVTKRQYAGIVSPTAKEGDLISVIDGGMVPFLLRKNGPEGSFSFVGECYVDGLMEGEAESLGMPEEVISLR